MRVVSQEVEVAAVVFWGLLDDLEARVVLIHFSVKGGGPVGHHLQVLVFLVFDRRLEQEVDSTLAGDPDLSGFLIFFGNERRKGHFSITEGKVEVLPLAVANAEGSIHGQRDGRQSARASVQSKLDTPKNIVHLRLDLLQILSADLDLALEFLLRSGVLFLRQFTIHHVEDALALVRFVLDGLIVLQALRDNLRQERVLVHLDRLHQ